MNNLLENQYVSTTLAVFLVLYGGLAAPRLPETFANLFTNPFFRMFVIFLIAYTSSKNHSIALIATITLVLIMQSSEEQVLIDDSEHVVHINRNRNGRSHRIMMDEELSKGDNKKKNLLKNSLVSEDQIVNAVINSELDTLQSDEVIPDIISDDSNLQTEIVNIEEELRKEPSVVLKEEGVPGPMDNNKLSNLQDIENTETPVKNQIVKTKKAEPKKSNIKSTRGLNEEPSRCTSCEYNKKDDYEINTNDLILPFSKNGLYNFNNL